MAELAIPGFVVGLAGLAAVFDKACVIWLTIGEAREYGEDIANSMSKIGMEYFKFQAWWKFLGTTVTSSQSRVFDSSILPSSSMIGQLEANIGSPLEAAAGNILTLLSELEEILSRNGVLKIASHVASQPSAAVTLTGSKTKLAAKVEQYQTRQRNFSKDLLKSTSWWRRFKHDAAPWKSATDKVRIQKIHKDFKYWNDSLYEILPQNIRESILQQAVAGFILKKEDDAVYLLKSAAQGSSTNATIIEHARLLDIRNNTRFGGQSISTLMDDVLADMRIISSNLRNIPDHHDLRKPFSILSYKETDDSLDSKVLVEWYSCSPYKVGLDTWKITERRIARLSYLLTAENRPRTLHSLNAIGFVDHPSTQSFGLVSRLPDWSSPVLEPVTLHQLLLRKVPAPLPTLEKRYELAAVLASTLYTFMLTRWHHKRYNSGSIYFLFPRDLSVQDSAANLSKPFIGGFSVSRPDAADEDTFEGIMTADLEIYLHPEMRLVTPSKRPKFRKSFEIYSFGILLAEIGFWNVLPRIALGESKGTRVSPTELRNRLIQKCQTDLACWMGERYREVTLRCLRAENTEDGCLEEDLNDFYWQVILELIKCMPYA